MRLAVARHNAEEQHIIGQRKGAFTTFEIERDRAEPRRAYRVNINTFQRHLTLRAGDAQPEGIGGDGADADGVVERRRRGIGEIRHHLSIPRDDAPAREYHLRAEIGERLHQNNVRQFTRRDCAEIVETVAHRAIQRRKANDHRWVHARVEQDTYAAIHVPMEKQIGGINVVGADGDIPWLRNFFEGIGEEGSGAAEGVFPPIDPHTEAHLLDHLRRRARFVLGIYSGGEVGRQFPPSEQRRVPFEILARRQTRLGNRRRPCLLPDDAGVIHQFRHADDTRPREHRRHIFSIKYRARRLDARHRRNGRWHRDKDAQRQPFTGAQHVLDARAPDDIADLVRVNDDGRRAEGEDATREVRRRDHRGLNMNVRVNEARHGDHAACVYFLPRRQPERAAEVHDRDAIAEDADVRPRHLAGVDIDHLPATNDEIERPIPPCRLNKRLTCHLITSTRLLLHFGAKSRTMSYR